MDTPTAKANTLWYHKDTRTYYFVVFDSSIPINYDMTDAEEGAFVFWLGNGDTRYKTISDLGEFVEEFDSYESAEPTLNKLINKNLVSGRESITEYTIAKKRKPI